MEAPQEFVSRLKREFPELRIRWSVRLREWHLEQQVGRAALPPTYVSEGDDGMIRAKDGYAYVMSIRPGTRMPCPHCGMELKVPVMETTEVVCQFCKIAGRDGRVMACYFPLNDILIDHLRKISPEKGGAERAKQEADAANEKLLKSRDRDTSNAIEAATLDNYNRLVGIPSVGYTGKEKYFPS